MINFRQEGQLMQNPYKSPLKPTAKSIPPRLQTSKPKSKQCVASASKQQHHIKRQVFNNQIYKNILSRMLSKNNIEQFLQETSKFIILEDEVIKPYQKGYYDVKNSQDFPELGRAMLRDGSFIRHFCRLLIVKEPWKEEEFKRYFYERYKNDICEKKSYFDTFFKLQIKEQSCNLSQSQQKMSVKKTPVQCSTKKSYKSEQKIRSQPASNIKITQQTPQPQQISHLHTRQQVYLYQPEETTISVQASTISKDLWTQGGQRAQSGKTLAEEEQSQCLTIDYERITMRHRGQSEEQRERRLLGLVDQSKSKANKHSRINGNQIIQFVDEIAANQRLKNIYESVKKERQQLQQASSNLRISRNQQDDPSPIKRLSYLQLEKQFQKNRISTLSSGIRSKMSSEYRDVLRYYPKVDKFAICEYVVKDNPVMVGRFRDKVVMKCFVTDLMQYLEPTYIAVYLLEGGVHQENPTTSQVVEESVDETVEVILIPRAQI